MKKVLLSLSSALIALGGFAQLSGTYTINSAQATGGTNYQTFAAATSALESSGVSAAVTFNVLSGTYSNDQVEFTNGQSISGASATNTITFQSDASNTSNPVLSNGSYTIRFYYSNLTNITFREIDIVATSQYPVYIYYGTANSIHFEDCNISNPIGTSGYALYLYRPTLQDFVVDGCNVSGGYYAMYSYYLGSNSSVDVTNSTIEDYYYQGIYGFNSYSPYCVWNIENNHIANNPGAYSYPYAMYLYYPGAGSNISNNTMELNGSYGGYGCYLYYAQGTSTNPVTFNNNMLNYVNPSNTGFQYGIRAYYTNYTEMDHNTVKCSGQGTNYGAYLYYYSGSYTGNTFTNNIISVPQGTGYGIYYYSYYNTMATTFSSFDYNAYQYGSTAGEIYNYDSYSGTTATSLANWTSGTSQDANSISADPSFVASNDLHSMSIDINNMGDYVGITEDIDGETRSTTSPDIGADEFSVPVNNAQPGGLLTPDAPLCSDDTTISIILQNPGIAALTTCSLNYSINGGTPVSSQWTGNLASQGDTIAIVAANISFTSGDVLMVWTSMPNGIVDSSAANDTVGVTLYDGLSGTFGIPGDYTTLSDAAADLELKGVCGHVVFNISAGTYNESVSIGDVDGTSEDATITFQGASGNWNDVTLDGPSSPTLSLSGVDYITFKDMKMTTSSGNVVQIPSQSDNVEFDHVWMRGIHSTSNPGASIIYMGGATDNFTLVDSKLEKGSSWMYSNSGSTTDYKENYVIEDNYMKDQGYGYGYLYYIDGLEMNRNRIINDSAFASTYAYFPMGYMNYVNNFNITRNYVSAEAGNGWYYGMYLINSIGSSNPRSQIANNCITTGNDGSTNGYYALYTSGSGLFDLYNNSFNHAATNSTYAAYIYSGGAITIKNNSFYNAASSYALYVYGGFSVTESDYNNFYNTGGSLLYFGSAVFQTLEDHQTTTGHDMNSISSDPDWEDVLTCVTCNEDMSNGGEVLATLTDDIKGNARSVLNPDIGAVEYVTPASFTLGGDDTVCGNEVIVEAGPAQSVTWNVNNQTSTQPSVTLTATSEPVTYNISVSITTEFCGSGSDNAIIRLVPDATLDESAHICADETLDLQPGGSSAATYAWSTGATTSSITVTEAGTYIVNKEEDGCESSATIAVTQSQGVEIIDLDACAEDLPLTVDATIADGTSYAWSDGNTTASNTLTDAGNYSVTATDSHGCTSDDDFSLTVLEEPEADIDENHSEYAYFFDASNSLYISANTTYLWDFGYNGQTATTQMANIVYPWSDPNNPTTYTVTLSIDNGCGTDSKTTEITPTVGIDDLSEGSFGLYPNPASSNVNFVLASAASAEGTIEVMDVTGRILATQIIAAGQTTGEVNVAGLVSGSYLVKITVDGNASVSTLIKQ